MEAVFPDQAVSVWADENRVRLWLIFAGGFSRAVSGPYCFQGCSRAKGCTAGDLQNRLCLEALADLMLYCFSLHLEEIGTYGKAETWPGPPAPQAGWPLYPEAPLFLGLPRHLAARTPWRGKKNFKCILRTTSILLLCRVGARTQRPSQEGRFDLLGRIHFPWRRLLEPKLWYEVRLV